LTLHRARKMQMVAHNASVTFERFDGELAGSGA
jgi:hypothetical protein